MGTWRIVTTSWQVMAKNLWLVGVIALFQLILSAIGLPLVAQGNQATGVMLGIGLAIALVQFFVFPLIQGGCLAFAASVPSQPSSTSSSFSKFVDGAKRLYGKLLGYEALTAVTVLGLAIVAVLLFGLSAVPAQRAEALGIVLVLLASAVVGIGLYLLMMVTTMAPVAIVVERLGVFKGIVKGLRVGRAVLGKLTLVGLMLGLTLLPAIIVMVLPGFFQKDAASMAFGWKVLAILLQSVVTGLATVLFTLAMVQIYQHHTGQATSASS
ncbi:MAG: hypothetical protein HYZ89_07285 [Candidatus Omnitrophica bacterium]|nr:hypothetical protein [Candidatus Omnitrophota bacterium]